ncbi:MAG: hypothetical protein ABJC62_08855 [Frankiaceae bacterium]
MDTKTRPAPLPLTDLESELLFYRSRWVRLSAALRRLRGPAWAPAASDDPDPDPEVAAASYTHAVPGINKWSAGP